jgi:hypothetical protein
VEATARAKTEAKAAETRAKAAEQLKEIRDRNSGNDDGQ